MKKKKNKKIKLKSYSFKAKVWKYKGPASWYFVTLPKSLSKIIRRSHRLSEEGWGRLKIEALIGECKWQTAIWFDSKIDSYLLPLKSLVRIAAGISEESIVNVKLCRPEEDSNLKIIRSHSFK